MTTDTPRGKSVYIVGEKSRLVTKEDVMFSLHMKNNESINAPLNQTQNHLKIAVLPGDGIGQEVMDAAIPVLEELRVKCSLEFGKIGWECWKEKGNPIPQATWDLIDRSDTILLGAITSKPLKAAEEELPAALKGKGIQYLSPVIQLRQRLGLFANVRPSKSWLNPAQPFRFTVIRENTEGLYAGLDFHNIPSDFKNEILKKRDPFSDWTAKDLENAVCSVRLMTRRGLERLFRFSFQYAQENSFSKVTLADKPNVLRFSSNYAKEILEEVAHEYPRISFDIQNADAVALRLICKPEEYGVIVGENMFGDLLSDLGAGVMGGLGLAPSANLGFKKSYFEPVHGSAPKYAGKNIANPIAMFLTIALMLRHHQRETEALRIEKAVKALLKERCTLSFDLGGSASTQEVAKQLIKLIRHETSYKTVSILSTGSELVQGEVLNTVSQNLSKQMTEKGIHVLKQVTVADSELEIKRAIAELLSQSDAVVITGGLGPTSDDRTRYALASQLKKKLIFDESVWASLSSRLKNFGIAVHESNRQQALFPEGATILPNHNGTAAGCVVELDTRCIFMLPGPPKESLPIFEERVIPFLMEKGYCLSTPFYPFKLLGVIEADIASQVDSITKRCKAETAYCWSYPFLEVKVGMPNSMNAGDFSSLICEIRNLLSESIVAEGKNGKKSASQILREYLGDHPCRLIIDDSATGGSLSCLLLSPETKDRIFSTEHKRILSGSPFVHGFREIEVKVSGLKEFWAGNKPEGKTSILIQISDGTSMLVEKGFTIPFRGPEVRVAAAEFASFQILNCLQRSQR